MQAKGPTAATDAALPATLGLESAATGSPGPQRTPPVPGPGRLPLLSDEIARAFLQDVQCPWDALFEVSASPARAKPVIMAREAPTEAACLPL